MLDENPPGSDPGRPQEVSMIVTLISALDGMPEFCMPVVPQRF